MQRHCANITRVRHASTRHRLRSVRGRLGVQHRSARMGTWFHMLAKSMTDCGESSGSPTPVEIQTGTMLPGCWIWLVSNLRVAVSQDAQHSWPCAQRASPGPQRECSCCLARLEGRGSTTSGWSCACGAMTCNPGSVGTRASEPSNAYQKHVLPLITSCMLACKWCSTGSQA